jgi:hypothetical protein
MDNKTPTNSEMFNPLKIIVLCLQKMGIPISEPSFHPIVKFSNEEKFRNTKHTKLMQHKKIEHGVKEPFTF